MLLHMMIAQKSAHRASIIIQHSQGLYTTSHTGKLNHDKLSQIKFKESVANQKIRISPNVHLNGRVIKADVAIRSNHPFMFV